MYTFPSRWHSVLRLELRAFFRIWFCSNFFFPCTLFFFINILVEFWPFLLEAVFYAAACIDVTAGRLKCPLRWSGTSWWVGYREKRFSQLTGLGMGFWPRQIARIAQADLYSSSSGTAGTSFPIAWKTLQSIHLISSKFIVLGLVFPLLQQATLSNQNCYGLSLLLGLR